MMKRYYALLIVALFLIPCALILSKFFLFGYSFEKILPKTSYHVTYELSMEGYKDEINIESFIPVSNNRQFITNESHNSGIFNFDIHQSVEGRVIEWNNLSVDGPQRVGYSFAFQGTPVQYNVDSSIIIEEKYPPGVRNYLNASVNIQSTHPKVVELAAAIIPETKNLSAILKSIYNYVYNIPSKPFKGLTTAVTVIKLNEASCNGKSRLFVALCRHLGIPARLVGGIILEHGSKRVSHQWVEVYINGYWVPFDALNGHYAFIPGNYLELYKGDAFLFAHTPNINFDYTFQIKKRMVSSPELKAELQSHPFNSYKVWESFEKSGIPLDLLKIIILLPLGTLIVAIFRNVIGIKTFGIFLPALIAISVSSTGYVNGMLSFLLVIIVVSLLHFPLEKMGILYTPKLVIMLVAVVSLFLTISMLGISIQESSFAYITLFPVVVVTITAERFARAIIEEGYWHAIQLTFQTLLVTSFAYLAMNSRTMEAVFLAFPELFLVVVGLMLLLGRWIGLRLSEYRRFKWMIS